MPESKLRHALVDTAIGCIGVAWSDTGIVRVQLPGESRDETRLRLTPRLTGSTEVDPEAAPSGLADSLCRYASGARVSFDDVAIDLGELPLLRRAIYAELRRISWGATSTYGEIARRIGEPGAARAVGSAMGSNPVPIILPCHRVLASNERSGGFSAPGGVNAKARLLALEGRGFAATPLLPGLLDAPDAHRP
jgi:methylated-DNA-[protein]-cysteine S-methyltransferase